MSISKEQAKELAYAYAAIAKIRIGDEYDQEGYLCLKAAIGRLRRAQEDSGVQMMSPKFLSNVKEAFKPEENAA